MNLQEIPVEESISSGSFVPALVSQGMVQLELGDGVRPRLGHRDVKVHPGGCGVSLWIHGPRSWKDAKQGCVDLGAPGWKRKWPKQEASAPNVCRRKPRKRFCQRGPWRVGVRGGGTVSGAQGCPEVELGNGRFQPRAQRQKLGCGGQDNQGGSSERVSAGTGRKGAQARPGRAGVWQGGVVSTPGSRRTASEPLLCRWLRLPRFPHLRNGTVRIKRVSRQDAVYC